MSDHFNQQIITQLAEQVTVKTPQFVRFSWNQKRCNGQGYLSVESDSLRLKGGVSRWLREMTIDVCILRKDILGWRRVKPNVIDFRIRDMGQIGMSSLRRIEFADSESVNRLMAWLPEEQSLRNLVRRWYEWHLGDYRLEAYASYGLIVFITLCFFGQAWAQQGWSFSVNALLKQGANYPPLTLDGEPWRLITAVFLHAGAEHAVGNILVLLLLSPYVERLYGRMALLSIFLVAGLAGSVVDLWTNFSVVAVGASGGVFGVLGALLVYSVRRQSHLPMRSIWSILVVGGGYMIWQLQEGFASEVVNNSAHVSGLVTGAILGAVIAPPFELVRRSVKWVWVTWSLSMIALSMSMIAVMWHKHYNPNMKALIVLEGVDAEINFAIKNCQLGLPQSRNGAFTEVDLKKHELECDVPLSNVLHQLKTLPELDQAIGDRVRKQVVYLESVYDRTQRESVIFKDVALIQPADRQRKRALEHCAAALKADKDLADQQRKESMADCIHGLQIALDELERLSPKTSDWQHYVHASKVLWHEEINALIGMQKAIQKQNVKAFDKSAQNLHQARARFDQELQQKTVTTKMP